LEIEFYEKISRIDLNNIAEVYLVRRDADVSNQVGILKGGSNMRARSTDSNRSNNSLTFREPIQDIIEMPQADIVEQKAIIVTPKAKLIKKQIPKKANCWCCLPL